MRDLLAALWSINEKLSGRPGYDLPEPTDDWLAELEAWELLKLEAETEAARKSEERSGRWRR